MEGCVWSIVQTQAVNHTLESDLDLPGWVPSRGNNPELSYHPVLWLRIGEPYTDYVDAILAVKQLPHPENYIILPHY